MKKLAHKLFFALIIFFVLGAFSCANAEYFYIKNYNTDLYIYKNSGVSVKESILVHFNSPRHGIFRKIPHKYKVGNKDPNLSRPFIYGNNYKINIYDIKVAGFKYKVYKKGKCLFIKIGDKNRFVNGDVLYKLSYKIYGAVNFFKDHSEFYYNVIGFEWPVPIKYASFNIFWPENGKPSKDKYFVYSGRHGSKNSNVDVLVSKGFLSGKTSLVFLVYNGITAGIWFPKGVIAKGSPFKQISLIIANNSIYLLLVLIFIFLFLLWYVFGRDKKIIHIVRYKLPDNITSAEAGFFIDDKTDNRDLLSLIFCWAAKGYIEIEETEKSGLILKKKDYILRKLKDLPDTAKSFERTIFYGLFSGGITIVKVSTLKNTFYTHMKKAKKQLDEEMTFKDYYEPASRNLAKVTYILAIIMFMIGVMFGRLDYLISFILSAIIFFIFARIMPKKTRRGLKIYQLVGGFKEFIERVEKPRLKRLLKKDPNYFDKILPYAIALGIEKRWQKNSKTSLQNLRGGIEDRTITLLIQYILLTA